MHPGANAEQPIGDLVNELWGDRPRQRSAARYRGAPGAQGRLTAKTARTSRQHQTGGSTRTRAPATAESPPAPLREPSPVGARKVTARGRRLHPAVLGPK